MNSEVAELVERAAELRKQLNARMPFTVVFKFDAFVNGTASFSWPERGAYLGLLYRQFDKGYVPKPPNGDLQQLAGIVNMPVEEFSELWSKKLAEKFLEHDGKLYNRVMLYEWIAQADYMMSRRKAGKSGGKRSGESRRAAATSTDEEPTF